MKHFSKLSKKQWLGMATAFAILVTAIGTFAAWDILDATVKDNFVTLRKPVSVKIQPTVDYTVAQDVSGSTTKPTAQATLTYTTENLASIQNSKLSFTPLIMSDEENGTDITSEYNVAVKKDSVSGTDVTLSGDTALTGTTHTYVVLITPKAVGGANGTSLDLTGTNSLDTSIYVQMKGTLSGIPKVQPTVDED